jgi:toxin-antitoxin system PIN domain toxin
MFLPDVNFWLALVIDSHVHYSTAQSWFDSRSSDECLFCRMTQQGFLRLVTNPKVVDSAARTLSEAWQVYDAMLGDSRIGFVREPAGLEPIWRSYTQHQSFSPKVWNDAFLAAFARAADCKLVTFGKGFTQYTDLKCSILS